MKLLHLKLIGRYKGLADQSFDFSGCTGNVVALVGLNGSGKSQLLELIAETFAYLERSARADFKVREPLGFSVSVIYELHAMARRGESFCNRATIEHDGTVMAQKRTAGEWVSEDDLIPEMLPDHIIGYSSGMNENVQRGFLKNAIQYLDVMSVRANRRRRLAGPHDDERLWEINRFYQSRYPGIFPPDRDEDPDGPLYFLSEKDTRISACVFLDYDCSALLMLSLALLRAEELDALLPVMEYREFGRVTITYDLRSVSVGEDSLQDIQKLINVAGEAAVTGISRRTRDEDYDTYGLDYMHADIMLDLSDSAVLARLQNSYSGGPLHLFERLYKIQLLGARHWPAGMKKALRGDAYTGSVMKPLKGNLPLSVTELRLSNGSDSISFDDLSDGEMQVVQVQAGTRLFGDVDALYLYDEPETHLNPAWRTEFHKYLCSAIPEIEGTKVRAQLFVSTHSPFMVSALRRENVCRFEKEEAVTDMLPPPSNPYGASFEVLSKELFGLDTLIARTAIDEIKALLSQRDLGSREKEEWISENMGDSVEKAYILRRLAADVATD